MAGVPNIFGNATTAIPLTQLDANFNTPLTIGNTSVGLGNTVTAIGNLTLNNVTITSGNINNAGNITLGNTLVNIGATAASVGNLTLTNTTVTNYTETLSNQTGNVTINLVNGTYQNVNVNSATTITLPNSVAGKSFTIQTYYTSNSTVSWAGGTSLKWAGNTTPTATAVTGKVDIFNFMQDGNVTYGAIFGQNY
jgi:hypothetical protein